jgi:hemoglobin
MQNRRRQCTFWAVLFLSTVPAPPALAQKDARAIEAVRAANQQLLADFDARDIDKVFAHYWNSPELFTVGEGGQVTKGWQAARQFTQGLLAATESGSFSCPEWQHFASTDGVLSTCAYDLSLKFKDGREISERGWYTNFRKRFGAKWLIVFEHVATNKPAPPGPNASLYVRLGGYDAIAALTDDFLGRLTSDKQTGRFFQGVSKAHGQQIRQLIVDFLCLASGGPCVYTGRDMKSSHAGLGITDADWDRAVALLIQSLDTLSVPERERREVLGALGPLKPDIVDKP